MNNYPNPNVVLDAARKAAEPSIDYHRQSHPEDVSIALSSAAETAGTIIAFLHFNGYLSTKAYE